MMSTLDRQKRGSILASDKRLRSMVKFTTLLGTYSLNENERVLAHSHNSCSNDKNKDRSLTSRLDDNHRHNRNGQIDKLLSASSCEVLRTLVNNKKTCSFPALELESFGHSAKLGGEEGNTHDSVEFVRTNHSTENVGKDWKEKKQVQTSELLSRPLLVTGVCTFDTADVTSKPYLKTQTYTKRSAMFDEQNLPSPKRMKESLNSSSTSTINNVPKDASDRTTTIEDIAKVPFLMMHNFSTSFSQLIESRLRVHCNFLKRYIDSLRGPGVCPLLMAQHGKCPTKAELKLETLLAIGDTMEIKNVVTSFRMDGKGDQKKDECGDNDVMTLPIVFDAIVDLDIPRLDGIKWKSDETTVSVQCPGVVTGRFEQGSDSVFQNVNVELNTCILISQMVEKACEVVRKVVQSTNAMLTEYYIGDTSSHSIVTPEFKPREDPRCPKLVPSEFCLGTKSYSNEFKDNPPSSEGAIDEDCCAIIDYAIGDFSS